MNTKELLDELKELIDSGGRSAKSEIQRISTTLKSGGHDKYYLASGNTRRRWEELISRIETYAKHPDWQMKAAAAVGMMRSGLPNEQQ